VFRPPLPSPNICQYPPQFQIPINNPAYSWYLVAQRSMTVSYHNGKEGIMNSQSVSLKLRMSSYVYIHWYSNTNKKDCLLMVVLYGYIMNIIMEIRLPSSTKEKRSFQGNHIRYPISNGLEPRKMNVACKIFFSTE